MNLIKNYFLWILPFLGFLFGYYTLSFNWQKKEISVPNIQGKNLQEAIKILAKKKLSLRFLREQEALDLPSGMVLKQVPKPYKSVKQNQTVFVTISKKPSKIIAPNFLADKRKIIVDKAKKDGIKLQFFWFKSIYPSETCVAQYPSAGQKMDKEKIIIYLSGQDKNLSIVPNFKNIKLTEVEDVLKLNEIDWKIICFKEDVDIQNKANLKVIDQKPMAGSIIDINSPIQFQLQVNDLEE